MDSPSKALFPLSFGATEPRGGRSKSTHGRVYSSIAIIFIAKDREVNVCVPVGGTVLGINQTRG